ncbi:iron complex transport system substrate-binding protein [Parafrankia irregularis]|uniref:Iron complex transport system substrate-binding protein n=1 Tax=Parafrankia irregularis TaxID=795642 RepID=A0A0S4QH54_9ACTN|nr:MULTISPECIES: ABC transporter substrate-binding protein [Parafrankia]CUU54912.1 iron complex transport system substrate-binding protein [Parafrankia irregularis]
MNDRASRPHRLRRTAPALALAFLMSGAPFAACGDSPAPAAAPSSGSRQEGFPVTVTNCGRTLHFDQAPSRIVSGWPTSTDLLAALGLTDRVVGQYNTGNGTAGSTYAEAVADIPVLSDAAPSRERLLAARPDLIWADGSYLFDGQQLPTIDELAAQGTQVMILSGFCTDDATRARVADVRTDLAALGQIFGVETRAQELTGQIDTRLAAVAAKVNATRPVPIAMISSFGGAIYTYEGVYSDIATRAGAINIYAGTLPAGQYYGELSKESLLQKNPGTLVYLLSGAETETAARTTLTETLSAVTAVRTGRVVFLPQWNSTNLAGVDGVETLAAALHP